jgi:hypothetical protein
MRRQGGKYAQDLLLDCRDLDCRDWQPDDRSAGFGL